MKILLLGDSIMAYMPKKMIGNETDEEIKHCYENMGVGTLYNYVWKKINIVDADINVLLIGINNLLRPDCDYDEKESIDDTVLKIEELITDIVLKTSGKLIVQALYPTDRERIKDKILYVNEKIESFCNQNDIPYLDLTDELKDDKGLLKQEYSKDGLHPNSECYNIIAQAINDKINSLSIRKVKVNK